MRKPRLIHHTGPVLASLAGGLALPYVLGTDPVTLGQLEYILVLIMAAAGLNIVLGFAGQLFLGPSALVAAGGYAAAVAATHVAALQSLAAMCLLSLAAAVAFGALLAIPALRMGGFYLGMVTLLAALAIPDVAAHANVTGGAAGISLLTDPTFTQSPSGLALYDVGLAMVAGLAAYSWLIRHSRLGRAFTAILSSEELAQSVAITPYRTKLLAFMLAAVPCGLAGAFYVYSQQFISPDSMSPTTSITVLAGVVIGGTGTIVGPLIGTALIGAASQFVGAFEKWDGAVYGLALMLAALALPSGFAGLARMLAGWFARWRPAGWLARWFPAGWFARRRPAGRFARSRPAAPTPDATNALAPGPPAAEPTRPRHIVSQRRRMRVAGRLVVTDVSRRFGGVHALERVDLTVEPGTVHALIGPNGSGKTTLLNLITGFYRADSGTITLAQHRLDQRRPWEISRLGVARTFQTPKLLVGGTVADNVVVAVDACAPSPLTARVRIRRHRSLWSEHRRRTAWALDQIGLGAAAGMPVEALPHGLHRLLEIARAVALEPAFLLLDEPTTGLSGAELERLTAAVVSMRSAGQGVLIVEHNLPVVFGLADEVTVLHEGRVLARGAPSSVASNPEVARVYLAARPRIPGRAP